MFNILLLRFDSPMIVFGGTVVDNHGEIQPFPALSMLAGMLGNALGYDHQNFCFLTNLQDRIFYAVRCDRPGKRLVDYQTVNLGQEFMAVEGWTTRGQIEKRRGGEASKGTTIRYRKYWADSVYTVALRLDPEEGNSYGAPSLTDVEKALIEPARPLFIGRKTCLPASPILLGRRISSSLLDCLRDAPLLPSDRKYKGMKAYTVWWSDPKDQSDKRLQEISVCDQRDWSNQIHVGNRLVYSGILNIGKEECHAS